MRRTVISVVLAAAVLSGVAAFNMWFEPKRMAEAQAHDQAEAAKQMEDGRELQARLEDEAKKTEAGGEAAPAGEAAKPAEAGAAETPKEETTVASDPNALIAKMETSKGLIEIKLFPDRAPVTVANFANLAKRGYYDGLTFHRVIRDFMIQGGDPKGTGAGGPGYKFKDEVHPDLKFTKPGILAMANAGPSTNGSQFFITEVPTPHLNMKHTIFGEVTDSKYVDVVKSVQQGDKIVKLEIVGDTAKLFEETAAYLTGWNAVLDKQ